MLYIVAKNLQEDKMRITTTFLWVLLCFLLFLTACDEDLLKPADYNPDNANRKPLFHRSLLMDETGDCYTGYRNFNIRPGKVKLEWDTSNDNNFLLYRLYRENSLITTIQDRSVNTYTDSLLTPNTKYHYTIVTQVRTGLSKSDTLSVKTASNLPPLINYRVNNNFEVILYWKDRSDIPGKFQIFKNDEPIGEVNEILPTDYEHIYSFKDTATNPYYYYTYQIKKVGVQDSTSLSSPLGVYVYYSMIPLTLNSLHQIPGTTNVVLDWTDTCTGETGFRIYRKESSGTNFSRIKTINESNVTQYTDTDPLVLGKTYDYYVTAIDAEISPVIETAPSNILSITIVENMQVEWQIALKDSYGDGWNGGYIIQYINGTPIFDYLTLSNGAGPEYYTFTVTEGDQIDIYYYPGNWSNENYYAILDQNGNIVAESGGTWNDPGVTTPGNLSITVDLGGGKAGNKAVAQIGGEK